MQTALIKKIIFYTFYSAAGLFLILSIVFIILRFTKYRTLKPFEKAEMETARFSEPEIKPIHAGGQRGTLRIKEVDRVTKINEEDD